MQLLCNNVRDEKGAGVQAAFVIHFSKTEY